MAHGRITMTDIARLAGCSQATVSLVLNNVQDSGISAETRQRVIGLARKTKYLKTPRVGRNIAPPGPPKIGMIVDRLTNTVAEVAEAIQETYRREGAVVLLAQCSDSTCVAKVLSALSGEDVIGLVAMTSEFCVKRVPDEFGHVKIPIVLVNCSDDAGILPHVLLQDFENCTLDRPRQAGRAAAILLKNAQRLGDVFDSKCG
jgi:LacI family transcriptional regulator